MTAAPKAYCIQNVAPEGPGSIAGALHSRGVRLEVLRADLGQEVPSTMDGAAGLVVMGGPMGVQDVERFPHLTDTIRLIADALGRGAPALGICLGSQLLASALGARVYRAAKKEIGWLEVTLTPDAAADPLFAGLPGSFVPLHWHGDVFDLPAGAVSLARSDATSSQAFRAGAAAYGLLFHLEATKPIVAQMVRAFHPELDAEHIPGRVLEEGAAKHLPRLTPIATGLFGRWADLVLSGT